MPLKPEEKYIRGHLVQWNVTFPLGRDPVTGKPNHHYKSIHGPRKDAQVYLDWYAAQVAAGETPKETIAQWELKQLSELELKAAQFKERLLAKVESGARVQPGPLSL